jgi:TetR/AcrR family transcriptional repressor of lmrAB and yxaGH operons
MVRSRALRRGRNRSGARVTKSRAARVVAPRYAAQPTRERILRAARHLFQERGYHGVGTADILDAAGAPKGSMYHHFPGGKEAIAIAAVAMIRDDLIATLDALAAKQMSVAAMVRQLARGMAMWLKSTQWREGTMLTSTAVGAVPELPQLHAAIREAFAAWRQRLITLLIAEGWSKSESTPLAQTIIAGLEGAMVLARVDEDERVVMKVADTLVALLRK